MRMEPPDDDRSTADKSHFCVDCAGFAWLVERMDETNSIQPIAPTKARFIKLGPGNAWAGRAIEEDKLYFGDPDIPFDVVTSSNWESVHNHWLAKGASKASASDSTRELREFCDPDPDALWITFFHGRLWWGFADDDVHRPGPPESETGFARAVIGGWRSTNVAGNPLYLTDLSTALLQTRAYRRTVCSVSARDYLIRKINGETDPRLERFRALEIELVNELDQLIRELNETDFEILIDLLAARLGWVRRSALGGAQADVDFVADLPALGVCGFFQVKSKADALALKQFLDTIPDRGPTRRAIFACHSFKGGNVLPEATEVWSGADLASKVLHAGLQEWVLQQVT
ncbi:hypothetical protein [Henriciella sp.]|uniref:hypothetical protein n=1 Tax=Henriciella sp. TaxID=1968823 RepID=UPI00262F3E46|nr:hypothetical protein [Henriciella sp.]